MEKAGTGITRVTNACIDNGNKVSFDFSDSFWVTIHSNENVTENVPENVPENRLNLIIELIKIDAHISMLDLSKKIGVNHKTVKRDILKLKSLGKIKRIGPAKGGHWEVV